jgi:hypothetical protein
LLTLQISVDDEERRVQNAYEIEAIPCPLR